jgi:phosphoribosyl-AMP cyclohydrolase
MNEPDFSRGVNGLLPAIAQDATSRQVLMFAWMNRDAYLATLQSGFATYFSRSRSRLWIKGEESGHRQRVTEIRMDCDADCILLQVDQTGAACHEGYPSCFFRVLQDGQFAIDQEIVAKPNYK